MRKVCIITVANGFLPVWSALLPPNIEIKQSIESFGLALTVVRLEGPGLPDWCTEPKTAAPYVWATAFIGPDGVMQFFPSPALGSNPQQNQQPQNAMNYEWLLRQHKNPN